MTLTGFGRKPTIPTGDEQDTRWILSHLLALSLFFSHSFLFQVPHTPDFCILPNIAFCLTTASFGVVGGLGRSIRVGYIYHSSVPSFSYLFLHIWYLSQGAWLHRCFAGHTSSCRRLAGGREGGRYQTPCGLFFYVASLLVTARPAARGPAINTIPSFISLLLTRKK